MNNPVYTAWKAHPPYYRISQPIRRTVIFSLEILEKNTDECILILVIYWKKTGLLHTKISNHNIIYSSLETQKIVVTATKIIFMVVFHYLTIKMLFNPLAPEFPFKFSHTLYLKCE